MKSYCLVPSLVWIFALFYDQCSVNTIPIEEKNSLVQLHVLFRHGNRTPNGPEELYPKDPYLNKTYYPFGLGQLTNAGKMREYLIGKALRARYNRFLGSYYYPVSKVEAISTDVNRTKMSLELVLAGLFPPKGEQVWNPAFLYLPIPYNYVPTSQDKILQGNLCPNYLKLYNQHVQSEQVQTEFNKYKLVTQYISKNTGLNVTSFFDVYNLYFGLATEEEFGLKLPEWTKPVWPQTITKLAIKEYFVGTGTTDLIRMATGYLFKKIIADTQAVINGSDTKIHLYSAHELNVANALIGLGVFQPPHIPNYGAYITFEVHKVDNQYGFKIYYENYTEKKPQLLKIPACGTFCPIEKFVDLVSEYLPSDNLCYE